MTRSLGLLLALALLVSACSGQGEPSEAGGLPTTVFLGDSVSAGVDPDTHQPSPVASWVTYAVRDPGRPWALESNASVYGETLADFQARFQTDVLDREPDAVVIMGGVNDTLRSTPVADSIASLTGMVQEAQAEDVKVWVVSPTPIDSGFGKSPAALVAAERDAVESLGATYVDVYDEVVTGTGDWKPGFSQDGVHPTEAGARKLASLIVDLAG